VSGYRQHFALKLLGLGNLGLNEQAHRRPVGDTADGHERRAAQNRAHHGVACGNAHIQIAAHHRLHRYASRADVNQFRFESLLLERTNLLRHPDSGENRANGRIGDGDLWRGLRYRSFRH